MYHKNLTASFLNSGSLISQKNLRTNVQKAIKFSDLLLLTMLFFLLFLISVVKVVSASEIKKTRIADVRVLVDISGSMKKTDPKNLRRPAIRLLAGLIPSGSHAGIWNFGKQVNMAVKIGTVNDNWRELAREQSKKISSAGLYTNIESAMRKVSFDWKKPDPRYKRNLILLTDGHVDVSKDDNLDKASRKRILKEILPQLEKAKVRIHTIALSDDVDESLLSTLSAYSDGLYKKVSNADDLQKLFLQMLEQSVKLDTLPLKDNRFNVDANVNDMTLLVFNKDKANPTTIVTPGKKTWNKNTHLENLKWFSDDGFDLITIKKPQHGQWKIMAPVDKSNRVVVATNLKLKTNDLPSYIMLDDVFIINAQLQEDGKQLSDKRLLSKFDFTIKRTIAGHGEWLYQMSRPEDDKNISSYQLPLIVKEGVNELVIKAKSPTAEREVRHQFKVYTTPAEINITEKQGNYEVKVTPYTNLLRSESVKANITLEDKSQHELKQHGESWLIDVDKKYHKTNFTLKLEATRADGKPMTVHFTKVLAAHDSIQKLTLPVKEHNADEHKIKEDISHSKKTEKKHTEQKKGETLDKKEDAKEQNDHVKKEENDVNWTLIIISIVAGNLLIVLVLGGGYVFMKRRKEKLAESISDEMKESNET